MTATLNQLIARSLHRPVRRCYIKRRFINGTYESNWFRIDYLGGQDRVIDWGGFSLEIDHQPGQISNFEVSALEMLFDNQEGYFNIETDALSKWYPDSTYLNRRYAKLKIDTAYLDEDDVEVGTATVFEGVIERVVIGEDQTARITALPYSGILQSYLIADLGLTGSATVSSTVSAIMNQSKITEYIPYVAPTQTLNTTIADRTTLEGSYWDVLKALAQQSNAIPFLSGSTWAFKDRSAGSLAWNFQGAGTRFADIQSVTAYDDEGADRVRVYWQAEGTSLTALSSDTTLKLKYLNAPQVINLDTYDNTNKQLILNALLAEWETPRPTVEFTTKFMMNQIGLLDKITLKIIGPLSAGDGSGFTWGGWAWGDGSTWGKARGSINISAGVEWMVTRIFKDIQNWGTQIKCEKVV
jgi:hypothetical protein